MRFPLPTTVPGSLPFLWLVLALAVGACVTQDEFDQNLSGQAPSSIEPEPPRPWTARFRSPTLLVADRAYLEGPRGLLEHLATRSEDDFHSYVAKAVPEGFRQEFKVLRPEAEVELRAYLDAFEIVVFEELIVLERPGQVDVLLRVSGDAYWRDGATGEERRGAQMEFVGPMDETGPAPRSGATPRPRTQR